MKFIKTIFSEIHKIEEEEKEADTLLTIAIEIKKEQWLTII